MCQAFQSSVTSSKQSAKFTFVDVNTGSLPAGVSKGSALQEMHVVDDHGAVFKSANSVLAVLDEYHNLRWLAVIGRSPFINSILMIGYTITVIHYIEIDVGFSSEGAGRRRRSTLIEHPSSASN